MYFAQNFGSFKLLMVSVICLFFTLQQGRHKLSKVGNVQHWAARYVTHNYTSRTPGCVTDMVNELGWESLQDRRQISRLFLLYKAHHGLVDIDKTAILKATQVFSKNTPSMRSTTTCSSQEHTKHEVYYNLFFPRTHQA